MSSVILIPMINRTHASKYITGTISYFVTKSIIEHLDFVKNHINDKK